MKEIGQELFSFKYFHGPLRDISFSAILQKVALCGDNMIKIVDVGNWKVFFFENKE